MALDAANNDNNELPLISISVIGHVDSGKSTLTGVLASRWGDNDERKQKALEKEAASNNKSSFSWAYFTDTTAEERKRGVTIKASIVNLRTKKFRMNFLDCPGHADYLLNASRGCKNADVAIAVVPANFQASCSNQGMLATHLLMAAALGSTNFCICINKLDELEEDGTTKNAESTFHAAVAYIRKTVLPKVPVDPRKVVFLPISALHKKGLFSDDNNNYDFYANSKECVTYKDENNKEVKVLTLEDVINRYEAPVRRVDSDLRIIVNSVESVKGVGHVYCGQVVSGKLEPGMSIKIIPANIVSKVKTIQEHCKPIPFAIAGMNIGFTIDFKPQKGFDKNKAVGSVVCPENDKVQVYPFYLFNGYALKGGNKENKKEKPEYIKHNYTPTMCGVGKVACKFVKLLTCIEKKNAPTVYYPDSIPFKCKFTALIYPEKEIFMEDFNKVPELGRVIFVDKPHIVAMGHVTKGFTEDYVVKRWGIDVAALKKEGNDKKKSLLQVKANLIDQAFAKAESEKDGIPVPPASTTTAENA